MSIIKPGCDSKYIIQKAMNSKSLATLAEETDTYEMRKGEPIDTKAEAAKSRPKQNRYLYNKAELEAFRDACKDKTPDEIFNKLGIQVEYEKDGTKSISHYKWPFNSYCFKAAGIDEKKLLDGVERIKGNCDLVGSELTNLGGVKRIGGTLNIPLFTKAQDLSSVEYIGGDIRCDAENLSDVAALIEKIKLNPKVIRGNINPSLREMYSRPYFMHTGNQDMETALKTLQARALYEESQKLAEIN